MQERHTNRQQYFQEQVYTTSQYVIPFIREVFPPGNNTTVLEIGCGEGGNLKPFLDMGCRVTGIDISESRITLARSFLDDPDYKDRLELIANDIYDVHEPFIKFDLIILRDVIEHIHNQKWFMSYLKRFLRPGGMVFIAFPPWYNPFGGHQQVCRNRILSKLPYVHLMPSFCYRKLLKAFGENDATIQGLMEVKETGLSIERFERILKQDGYRIVKMQHYLINPNYEIKFRMKPRKQNRLIAAIPFVSDFLTTSSYYLVSVEMESCKH
ncbi:MAG TPA: class I SAM-dependent methyltransferase [Bacteroidales bacterium]|nr:class I SAM-dependent methyltransferase [Bacteroidales bacterium]HRZ21627.1 class I SAM-dependent methyltransferase [Bacteroidales bacterium]